ncbi:MAG: PDZ domain-containing protein, partial [Thermomicrobia bacterium]|nr:PDZ domain-containing protein [Thermomicrobia bacterium]MCA1725236.1 PDZ domain-containing protein [Thermomicrobia bacterium]
MDTPSPARSGAALVGFLVGIVLVLSGFALGIVADRTLFSGATTTGGSGNTAAAAVVIPTVPPLPTDTVAPGRATSTPRPVATPVPSVTPRPSDPAISLDAAQNTTPDQLRAEFDNFWKAFNLLEKGFYYRPLNEQNLVYGALKGMFSAAGDDYTVYLPPDAAKDRKASDNGQFVGIGVYVDTSKDGILITAPIPGGPAEAAGVKAGDVIVAIDGKDITALAPADRTAGIAGAEGTPVRLTIRRDGTPGTMDITVTRKKITVPAVTLDVLPNDIGKITITSFNDYTNKELDDALTQVRDKHLKGIVLDLRNNGGGYVDGAQQLLGRFLPQGSVAMLEDRRPTGGKLTPLLVKNDGPQFPALPLVMLVNGGTASASEIAAGSLQDYGRATLVGTKTFGKGSEQEVTSLSDGASVRITVANRYPPKERVIQKAGLTPDFVVERPTT